MHIGVLTKAHAYRVKRSNFALVRVMIIPNQILSLLTENEKKI